MGIVNYNQHGIISGFLSSVEKYPDRQALDVESNVLTYKELSNIALNITDVITKFNSSSDFVSLLAYRSVTAFSGILGILASGKGYVPLNPGFPIERIYNQLELSKSDILIVGRECLDVFVSLLNKIERPLKIILPDRDALIDNEILKLSQQHEIYFLDKIVDINPDNILQNINLDSSAYLLFTSGSTGIPKGVAVSHSNVKSFVDYICNNYTLKQTDRFSQTADINFDLSVLEIFPCWEVGGCLCCLPKEIVMAPARYIRDKELTVWVSVPSVGIFMSKMRLLKPDAFPGLRYCMFCGEALLQDTAEKWSLAAPNSVIVNLYGPTEATVAITQYNWNEESSNKCSNGIVPIGWTFSSQQTCIVDEKLNVLKGGESGELCLSGTQLTKGYFNNIEKTLSQFIKIPEYGDKIWYRTGDLVYQESDGCMHYLGRIDNQVQVLGYRVELQEIDNILRKITGTELAVSIPWPIENGVAQGITAFICGGDIIRKNEIISHCEKVLPSYMIPREIFFIDNMPVNANGKIDRLELTKIINGEA
ncbi:MAG: AMP-binding protein [Gammaproteobacteria bacterium]|nr:AMP-binding protein [Gammaproteobacteria bacterium]